MVQLENVIDCYKTIAQIPTLVSARILNKLGCHSSTAIISSWSQRNLEVGKTTKFQQLHFIGHQGEPFKLLPLDTSNELLSSFSNSETHKAVLREMTSESSSKKQCLEIWKHSHLWKSFDLGALDVHGDVYTDAEFGGLEWSPCESRLLYVAEQKLPKAEPFYKRRAQVGAEATAQRGGEYVFRPDWGEQLAGRVAPAAAVLDVWGERVEMLNGVPAHLAVGQLLWAPGGGVVGVAWESNPRKLGLVHCTNRRSYIFYLSESGRFEVLSAEGCAVRSPRFSPDGRRLLWLQRAAGGPHHAALSLVACAWPGAQQKRVLIDIVHDSLKIHGDVEFHGLYNMALPKRCWRGNSEEIVFSTPQKNTVNSYSVNIDTGCIAALHCDDGSLSVLDVLGDMVVCSKSSFKQAPLLVVGQLRCEDSRTVRWAPVMQEIQCSYLEGIAYSYMSLTQEDESDTDCNSFSAMFIGPKDIEGTDVPLVVCPHGGPHGVSCNVFSFEVALFVTLGFGVLLVNYRGSVGAGQRSVDFLPGRIGISDVSDIRLATREALKQFPFLNPKKVVLYGWSHGGFLVTHLSGQYPSDYKAVVAGNPVTDVAAMFSVTDIPDWVCTEAGLPYDPTWLISADAFETLKKCSSISFINNSVAPTLLLIGKKDARVPGSQGIQYYYGLKARDVKTSLLLYDDNHSLKLVPIEMDNLINTIMWLSEHVHEC